MNDLTIHHKLMNQVFTLRKQLKAQREMNRQLKDQREVIKAKNDSKVFLLLKLVLAGRINLTTKEIAELCYVTQKSVIERKSRMKKDDISTR